MPTQENSIICEANIIIPVSLNRIKGKLGEITLMMSNNYSIIMNLKKFKAKKIIESIESILSKALEKVKGRYEKALMIIDIYVWDKENFGKVKIGINFEKKPWETVIDYVNEDYLKAIGLSNHINDLVSLIRRYG